MSRVTPFLLPALLAAGCRALPADPAAEVLAETRAFEAAENARDAAAVIARLDPAFYMYQDGLRVGYDAIVGQIEATLPGLRSFDATFEDVEVTVLGPGACLVSLVFRDAITDAAGVTTRSRGASTLVWLRRPEGWRIVYADSDHYPDG